MCRAVIGPAIRGCVYIATCHPRSLTSYSKNRMRSLMSRLSSRRAALTAGFIDLDPANAAMTAGWAASRWIQNTGRSRAPTPEESSETLGLGMRGTFRSSEGFRPSVEGSEGELGEVRELG